jgi:hypothetical protein
MWESCLITWDIGTQGNAQKIEDKLLLTTY